MGRSTENIILFGMANVAGFASTNDKRETLDIECYSVATFYCKTFESLVVLSKLM